MNHSLSIYSALICTLTAAMNPTLAGTWNPVSSDAMDNTAIGTGALSDPDLDADGGCHNTADGAGALNVDSSGSYNTATGFDSLYKNLTGNYNTGFGTYTLYSNTSGQNNTASGFNTLYSNTSGGNNTADGSEALHSNTMGNNNTASGFSALHGNLSGSNNIAMGYYSGSAITGSNNIDLGNTGSAADNGVIRIGANSTQHTTFIAGIATKKITGSAVFVTAGGELGVLASSERYKTAITSMGNNAERLQQLRPVTFHLKTEPTGALQYGLIAEEVDRVYPELVIRDEAGKIQGVRYDELAPILLNEVQAQHTKLMEQNIQLKQQGDALREMQQQVAEIKRANDSMQAAMAKLLAKDERVAMR
jgi:hypothetical protein